MRPDDGDVIAEICRRDRNYTVVSTVCAYVGFVSKTYIVMAPNEKLR
jgi:hypothetical protein